MQNFSDFITEEFHKHIEASTKALPAMLDSIQQSAQLLVQCLKDGGKVLICGNGGSAADSQHFAAELTGRYKRERKGLPAIALSVDTSALTAIGNDYGYEFVFSRQVQALANKGDIIFGISTSGNSANVLNAFKIGKEIGCKNIGLSGRDGGAMNELCAINLIVPSNDTPRIQEVHILVIHALCDIIENQCG